MIWFGVVTVCILHRTTLNGSNSLFGRKFFCLFVFRIVANLLQGTNQLLPYSCCIWFSFIRVPPSGSLVHNFSSLFKQWFTREEQEVGTQRKEKEKEVRGKKGKEKGEDNLIGWF